MAPPQIFQLSVASVFDGLEPREKVYAHHMAKAAWSGTRIILRQVSPEAESIFDFIMALYRSCDGDWIGLARQAKIHFHEVQMFLEYAATFLSNVGNYYGSGDQKFIPEIPKEKLEILAVAAGATSIWRQIQEPMYQTPPLSLGPPSEMSQSMYYSSYGRVSFEEDTALVSRVMEELSILPENTRLQRASPSSENVVLHYIFQASVTENLSVCQPDKTPIPSGNIIYLVNGDHKDELERINMCLEKALQWVSNPSQYEMIRKLQESFVTGDLNTYKDSQKIWVKDKAPPVEAVLGFVEPYRDPLGIRSEFEGIVGIPDVEETRTLNKLSEQADRFVRKLPWVSEDSSNKGPFEKEVFEAPDFSSVKSLAYCSSIIFPGINLPNYNDIRQETGYKNIIFSNRMVAESQRARGLHLVDESEQETFKKHRPHAYYIWVVLHEILGHGTGRFLTETTPGNFNFDPDSPPLDLITGEPIKTWYRPGQTWTGVFEDLSTTVDECRAELVGAYLIDDRDILALFGYTEHGEIKPEDLVYNMYLQLSTDGLRGLENYDPITKKWGQAHSRAHYAMFRHLLRDSKDLYTVICDPPSSNLTVKVDRARVIERGKPSLGRMLLRLHIYRCTADSVGCRGYYEDLSNVDDEALRWREIVVAKKDPPLAFCHANTYLNGDLHDRDCVKVREYEPTARGVIRSWAERKIDSEVI